MVNRKIMNHTTLPNVKCIHVSEDKRFIVGSSSKGNQPKWTVDDMFIKADFLGYESISEVLVSMLLDCTNIPHVKYDLCEIVEDMKPTKKGCYCYSFLKDDEKDITFYRLLSARGIDCLSFTYDEIREEVYAITKIDIQPYVDACLCIDAITRNEDRHFNNLSIIKGDSGYRLAPLYDNGLACLADIGAYPIQQPVKEAVDRVYAKPFYTSFKKQLELVCEPISIDIDKFTRITEQLPAEFKRPLEVIQYMLQELEGLAWRRS